MSSFQKQKPLFFLFLFLGLVSIIAVASSIYVANKEDQVTLANNRIKEIFSGQERLCFGRFLVDIPSDSIVAYGPAQLDGEITVYPNSATNISELVNSQLIKINNRRSDFPEYSLEEQIGRASCRERVF